MCQENDLRATVIRFRILDSFAAKHLFVLHKRSVNLESILLEGQELEFIKEYWAFVW